MPIKSGHAAWLEPVLARPGRTLLAALFVLLLLAVGLGRIVKDGSVDAFVPLDHPAAVARDKAADLFGLEDPIVIGLSAADGDAFQPAYLEALRRLHDGVRKVPDVRKDDVLSLAGEKAMLGDGGDLEVEPFLPDGAIDAEAAATAKARAMAMPMLRDRLYSASGDMLVLLVPLADPNHGEAAVAAVQALVDEGLPEGLSAQVAGVATMNARLSEMVSGDTRIFVPAAVLTVLLILWAALRRPLALIGPLAVIAGAALASLGLMGWTGGRYYLITTALPVVVMAIAVADSVHICSHFLEHRRAHPDVDARRAAREAIAMTFLPVTLTSVTTVAGFLGLAFGAAMRPISEFGVYAAAGVMAAWALSLTVLPAILVLTNVAPGTTHRGIMQAWLERLVRSLTGWSAARPVVMLAVSGVVLSTLLLGAMSARFDYQRRNYFMDGEAVRAADLVLNDRLGGINFLDVSVTAPEEGGLMTPQALRALAELRADMAAMPHVGRVSGIDEHLAYMHSVLTGAAPGELPSRDRAPAQYMFLYEASGEPDDFHREISADHSAALLRAQLDTDRFTETEPLVEALQLVVDDWSAKHGLEAVVSGRVAVNDGWMSRLADKHFQGLGLACLLVFLASWAAFRSWRSAALAMVPVLVGVLFVYAAMGFLGIDIAPATSMTAAIATGLGVDFAIHLISQVRVRLAEGATMADAFDSEYRRIAVACVWCAVSPGGGADGHLLVVSAAAALVRGAGCGRCRGQPDRIVDPGAGASGLAAASETGRGGRPCLNALVW